MDIEKANAEALDRMIEARPVLVGLGKARDVVPGMRENLLMHAGPPIDWDRASGPMPGAILIGGSQSWGSLQVRPLSAERASSTQLSSAGSRPLPDIQQQSRSPLGAWARVAAHARR